MTTLTLPAKVQSRACFTQLLGLHAIHPEAAESILQGVRDVGIENIWKANEAKGAYPQFSPAAFDLADALGIPRAAVEAASKQASGDDQMQGPPPYINYRGTAIIPVNGPLSKMPTSLGHMFGGSSTVGMRKALALALADSSVQRVMLHIDSPGGTVAGTGDLGDELFGANMLKPTASFVEDLGASAAYWLASQTGTIYSSPHAQVGSIGVIRVVHDTSQMAEAQGVKVHVLKTGPYKGGPVPGTPITPDALKHMQAEVDAFHKVFVSTIARGRELPESQVSALADGRVFMAPEALKNGLVDAVGSFAAALQDFAAQHNEMVAVAAKKPKPADGDERNGVLRRRGGVRPRGPSYSVLIGEPRLDGNLLVVARNYSDSTGQPLAEALAEAGVDLQQEGTAQTVADELAAATTLPSGLAANGDASYTPHEHVLDGDAHMADPQTTPAGKSAAEPVTLTAAAHEALLRKAEEGSQALRLVQEMKEQASRNEKAVLDSERERIMADYGLTKEQVSACPDLASLKALESVARSTGRRGTSAAARDAESSTPKVEEFDAWAAHQTWKDSQPAVGLAVPTKGAF